MTKALVVNRDGTMRLAEREGTPPAGFISKSKKTYIKLSRSRLDGIKTMSDLIDVYEESGKTALKIT